jgi:hypothetical protein
VFSIAFFEYIAPDSTFAEHFYSLKRVLMLRGADPNASAPALLEESASLAGTSPTANPAASSNEFAGSSRIPEPSASSSAAIPLPKNPQLAAAVTLSQQESEARGERELQPINRTRALFFLVFNPNSWRLDQ